MMPHMMRSSGGMLAVTVALLASVLIVVSSPVEAGSHRQSGQTDGLAALRAQARAGDMAAQVALGTQLMDSLDDATAADGVRWLEKAALQGAPVYCILGDAYADGVGVAQNADSAARWYRLGAELGDGLAQYELAKLYLTGTGVNTDIVRAVLYLKLADKRVYEAERRREIAELLQRARWWTSWEEWKRVEELLAQWEPKTLQDLLN